MANNLEWDQSFNTEIERAQQARSEGNEGMARVCARRAAGIVVGEYFRRNHLQSSPSSAYDRLKLLRDLSSLPYNIQQLAEVFLIRITPEHKLPIEADLIALAMQLKSQLLSE